MSLSQSPSALVRYLLLVGLFSFSPFSQADTVTIPLSQEQDGGDTGRACIYIWHGSAQYRVIKADESCASAITIDSESSAADDNI
ncbi:hypothetical protein [Erwinia piriflorinigrans]|uniref:Uncharacterized protein n=1 Tax=Erwinia piriflorinigrans CFBP 5888 TaxID=1161919 RepID=V5Z4X1_9GAMM|nr:hypothetical protein [Erwinia piriflorinigrans]CCG86338.1 hypothetical protein EPIR_0973 [Erwinia piriflorinigrans CFBP 5888]